MFDPFSETPIRLAKARKLVPGRRSDGVNIATIHRWHRCGVHGVRLETILIGGIRHTSREAMARFIVATTREASPADENDETPAADALSQASAISDETELIA